jgi:hypothetical protein
VTPFALAGAAGVLVGTLVVGVVAHELTHALVLRAFGVRYDIVWLPDHDAGERFGTGVFATWATVVPLSYPRDVPTWGLRLAAVAPLALATPFVLVPAGVVSDPVAAGGAVHTAAVVAWLACALPSPQDFSQFFHATQVLDGPSGPTDDEEPSAPTR